MGAQYSLASAQGVRVAPGGGGGEDGADQSCKVSRISHLSGVAATTHPLFLRPPLQVTQEVYKGILGGGAEAKVGAIHAGLECGLLGEKFPGMDMVRAGNVHEGSIWTKDSPPPFPSPPASAP